MPPMRKLNSIPRQNSIGTSKRIFAFHKVPSVTRNKNPVGMEISSVVNMKSGLMSGLMPLWNRWCCQTKNDKQRDADHPGGSHPVGEERFSREDRQHLHDDAEARQRHDVDLGMAEEPEEVLPQEAAPPVLGHIERSLSGAVQHAR